MATLRMVYQIFVLFLGFFLKPGTLMRRLPNPPLDPLTVMSRLIGVCVMLIHVFNSNGTNQR